MLNACIGAIGTTLGEHFDVDLPEFEIGRPSTMMSSSDSVETETVLLFRINMELSVSQVKGYLVFLLGPTSLENLQTCLKIMLEKFNAKPA